MRLDALPRLPASPTSIVLTVQPVGSVHGILLLGEDPAPLRPAGVAVIAAGIVVATRRAPRSGRLSAGTNGDDRSVLRSA